MGIFDPYGQRKGSFRTDLTASTNIGVPTDGVGTLYNTSAALLATNSVLKNCRAFNIHGFTVKAVDASDRTLTFFGKKSDGTTYDQSLYVLTVKASTAVGTYIPIGGPDGEFFIVDPTFLPTLNEGGFAFQTSNVALLGSIWWTPLGPY